jgi:suppressor for copper-sensitivity B
MRPFTIKLFSVLSILLLGLAWSAEALARAASPWARTDQTAVRLVSATQGVGAAETLMLGLHFQLQPGWKIYWRSPGDAGFPPHPVWTGSENLGRAVLSWPAPERFSILGFETRGYKEEVVIPITVTPAQPGQPVKLRALVDYLTCDDICIPYKATLALDLPAGEAGPSAYFQLINRFAVTVPGKDGSHGVKITSASVAGAGKTTVLRVAASTLTRFQDPDVFVEGAPTLGFAKPKMRLGDGGRTAILEIPVAGAKGPGGGLEGKPLTLTLVDGTRSGERALTVTWAAGQAAGETSLAWFLVLALLGGLILNLMPCVLPVLSIKLLHVVGHGGADPREVRVGFVATAAGILFSFLVLAGALIALKAAGGTVGWGIQFQHPWFLISMIVVVTLFASNLWGFFEVRLPQRAGNLGNLSDRVGGLGGHFLTGAFATILATPCSAPFLGTAVSFALARGPAEILAVFAVLGIGLSLPYLLVAAVPTLATRLPRPGRWMVVLRRVLGFALAGTALWLLSVLSVQLGWGGAGLVGLLMAVMVGLLFKGSRLLAGAGARVGVLAVLAVLALLVPLGIGDVGKPDKIGGGLWKPFDEAAIPGHIAQGHTVFVDVTADWCITCQVNKAIVIGDEAVRARLDGEGVFAMQADWTRPDPDIAGYLAKHGRYGIPFNAVFGPGAPEGIMLPELLTPRAVLDALSRVEQ